MKMNKGSLLQLLNINNIKYIVNEHKALHSVEESAEKTRCN